MRRILTILCIVFLPLSAAAQPIIGKRPAVETHLDQPAIDTGKVGLAELIAHGQLLFNARFNRLDGQGRPASTGTGEPRVPVEPAFIRTSAPESNSCAGCHAQPRAGGAGDFVANLFVLAQASDPCISSVDPEFSIERNTLGMMGAGAIEMLAREMSTELIMIREEARDKAMTSGGPVTRKLWDVGNTDPYGHRGDLTTITEAIYSHGGEARDSRDSFFGLPQADRNAVIEFLKTLQVLPDGSPLVLAGG